MRCGGLGLRRVRRHGIRWRGVGYGRGKHCGRFRHFVGFCRHSVGRQRQRRLVGRGVAFGLHQHVRYGTRPRFRIGHTYQIVGQRAAGGFTLSASDMVFVRSDFAVEQHLGVVGNIDALRVFGSQQRPPTLQRKISFANLRTAIAGIRARKLVHFLIARIAGMALDPYEFHRSRTFGNLGVDRANQIRVLHRLLLRVLPAVLLPAMHPRGGTVDRILRISFDHQRFGTGMRAQRLQHCAQFADLVGAVRCSTGVAIALMVVPRFATRREFVIGPTPTHWTIRITQSGTVCRNRNRHASTLRKPCDSLRARSQRASMRVLIVQTQHGRSLEHAVAIIECGRAVVPFGCPLARFRCPGRCRRVSSRRGLRRVFQ